MERILADKQCNYSTKLPTNCNKIDLTLKLSPCGENAEERRLTRSSSVVENGSLWGPLVPSLDRSWSLPAEAEKGLMKFAESVAGKCPLVSTQMLALVAASAVKTPTLACANDKLKAHGDSQLEETFTGGSYNIPYMVPRCLAEGGVGSNMQSSTMEENDSMVSRKTMAKDIQHENPPKKLKLGNYCSLKGDVMEILRQMLSVSTTGDGPNGKRIEGFLYKYRSGQVCIVCVCHGSFLTPAEFVMHAGGKEVVNPMKHITVYSNNSF